MVNENTMSQTAFPTVPVSDLLRDGLVPDATPPPPLVLVVDDEQMIAQTLALILEKAGFATTVAYDGEGALQIANVTPPDLLLSDVVMPGMNGFDLAIEITQLAPDCQVLLLSGQTTAADLMARSRGDEHKFTLLAKPIHPRDLLAEITRMGTFNPLQAAPYSAVSINAG